MIRYTASMEWKLETPDLSPGSVNIGKRGYPALHESRRADGRGEIRERRTDGPPNQCGEFAPDSSPGAQKNGYVWKRIRRRYEHV